MNIGLSEGPIPDRFGAGDLLGMSINKERQVFLAPAIEKSIVALAEDIVKKPTPLSPGKEPPATLAEALEIVKEKLLEAGIDARLLTLDGRVVGLAATVEGAPGPHYCLNACIDTTTFNASDWRVANPEDWGQMGGKLYGRGAADSKIAVSIFSHIVMGFNQVKPQIQGKLSLLIDADEHSGAFKGVQTFVEMNPDLQGVMIGYPGNEGLGIGARGIFRVILDVFGEQAHSGSTSKRGVNSVNKVAEIVQSLKEKEEALRLVSLDQISFGQTPSITVTHVVTNGEPTFSNVPDNAKVWLDFRLTPNFQSLHAEAILKSVLDTVDKASGGPKTTVEVVDLKPPYKLSEHSSVVQAVLQATYSYCAQQVRPVVAGPSNIGNYLASKGIDATCGFGVKADNVHGVDEAAHLRDVPMVYAVYADAAATLLEVEDKEGLLKRIGLTLR